MQSRLTAVLIGSWAGLGEGEERLSIDGITVERGPSEVRPLQQTLRDRNPTCLLVGLGLDDEIAAALVRAGQAVQPQLHVCVLGALDDLHGWHRWTRRGCSLYLACSADPACVQFALAAVASHEIVVIDRTFCTPPVQVESPRLTGRERDVLELVVTGLRTKDIANRLHLSQNTVESHLRNLFAKMQVSTRAEAVHKAIRTGVV